MEAQSNVLVVRPADLSGSDAIEVRRLVEAYLVQTEREKADHLGAVTKDAGLPARYTDEVDDPARAYAQATVYLAELGDRALGVLVVQRFAEFSEIKRVWVDPRARGQRAGAALLDAGVADHDRPIRLSVWDWRDRAIRLYRTRGFATVPTWDARPRLLCMERRSHTPLA